MKLLLKEANLFKSDSKSKILTPLEDTVTKSHEYSKGKSNNSSIVVGEKNSVASKKTRLNNRGRKYRSKK